MEVHGGLKAIQAATREVQQELGTVGTRRKIKAIRQQLDNVFTFHLNGWMLVIGIS